MNNCITILLMVSLSNFNVQYYKHIYIYIYIYNIYSFLQRYNKFQNSANSLCVKIEQTLIKLSFSLSNQQNYLYFLFFPNTTRFIGFFFFHFFFFLFFFFSIDEQKPTSQDISNQKVSRDLGSKLCNLSYVLLSDNVFK